MAKRVQKRKVKSSQPAASVCWFDVPADDLGRAKKFYGSLFGWKFAKLSAAVADYWHIDTGGKEATPDGGLPRNSAANFAARTGTAFAQIESSSTSMICQTGPARTNSAAAPDVD